MSRCLFLVVDVAHGPLVEETTTGLRPNVGTFLGSTGAYYIRLTVVYDCLSFRLNRRKL